MNNERAQQVIDAILAETVGKFDMAHYFRTGDGLELISVGGALRHKGQCGTVCCIAGTAAVISGEESGSIYEEARQWLDLTHSEAEWLFCGNFSDLDLQEIRVEDAIAAIKWLMDGNPIQNPGWIRLEPTHA